MQVECSPDPEIQSATLVAFTGRLDALGATALWDAAEPHLAARPSMLVNMRMVAIVGSAGISSLMRILTRVKQRGGELALFGCSDGVRKIFRIVGLEGMLNVCDSEAEARSRITRA